MLHYHWHVRKTVSKAWESSSSSLPSLLSLPLLLHPLAAPSALAVLAQPGIWRSSRVEDLGNSGRGLRGRKEGNRHRALWALWMQKPDSLQRQLCCSWSLWGASISQDPSRQAPSSRARKVGASLLGADNTTCLSSATMSGCSKRCKLGFVKFAQTIFKLITGTLSKGREPGLDLRFLSWCGLAGPSASAQ